MTRPNRSAIRIYFLAVILMGLFGFWYAGNHWQVEASALENLTPGLEDSGDWVDFAATLGEEVLQLFLGFTSDQ